MLSRTLPATISPLLLALVTSFLMQHIEAAAQTYSELWGQSGEKWSADGRIPDYSYAGYHFGEDPLPDVEAVSDVTDFGAVGDGKTDCTQAFIKAIDATDAGAITIPPGRFVISNILWIRKPNIVLRGAGPDKTFLTFVTELEDVRPNMGDTSDGRPTSNYSWSGGFLWLQGRFNEEKIADITADAPRGSRTITLATAPDLAVGQQVEIHMTDGGDKSLLNDLYSGDPGDTTQFTKTVTTRMIARVASVEGNKLKLDRPLWLDVKTMWKPVLKTFEPTVTEVGIEDLTLDFPNKPYAGHFTERGMNGIAMTHAAHCWVRNIRIRNCDSGLFLTGVNCTADGVVVESQRQADPNSDTVGHHALTMGRDCVLTNFQMKARYIHDLTVSNLSTGNVVKNGTCVSLNLDHHKRAPYQNLFTNLDAGDGTRLWKCGGGAQLGKNCGARATFWNIRARNPIAPPPDSFAPDSITIVGLPTDTESILDPQGQWFEAIPPNQLHPPDLHAAQLNRRLNKQDP